MDFFWDLLLYPGTVWETSPAVSILLWFLWLGLAVIFVGIVGLPISWIVDEIWRRRHFKECTHCGEYTRQVSEGQPNCPADQPCCSACMQQHGVNTEQRYRCPHCYSPMDKVVDGEVVYDRCTNLGCRRCLLSADELRMLLRRAYKEGDDDGTVTGMNLVG